MNTGIPRSRTIYFQKFFPGQARDLFEYGGGRVKLALEYRNSYFPESTRSDAGGREKRYRMKSSCLSCDDERSGYDSRPEV
jgi:hypothetical protein